MIMELTMPLSGRQPGNRRIHALGNPRNGIRKAATRLQHLTLNELNYKTTHSGIYTQQHTVPGTRRIK